MNIQITIEELKNYKSRDPIPLKCKQCNNIYYKPKNEVLSCLSGGRKLDCCSNTCRAKFKQNRISTKCKQCGCDIILIYKDFIKSNNHFCNHTCSGKFNANKLPNKICPQCKISFHSGEKDAICCSKSCASKYRTKYRTKVYEKQLICTYCNKEFTRKSYKKETTNQFCNMTCRNKYNLQHHIKHASTSKLEKYLKDKILTTLKPKCLFNSRKIINPYELDLYFPDYKLGIEFNGIIHYKPIYGEKRLINNIKKDKIKSELCLKNNIQLITIDVSKDGNFNEQYGLKYFEQIKKLLCGISVMVT